MGVRDNEILMDMDIVPQEDLFEISKSTNANKKRNEIIRRILAGELTERQRQCLKLHFGDGMTLDEIGSIMNIKKSTVSKHIKLGKLKIRRCLEYAGEKGNLHFDS